MESVSRHIIAGNQNMVAWRSLISSDSESWNLRIESSNNWNCLNGRLKEEFGGRYIMVRRSAKAMMHLMFGVGALFADQNIKITGY